jgi:DNA-binding LytR/AlgR family response regulator
MDFIESIETGINGRLHLQLRGGPEVEVSRRQAILFRARSSI